MNTDNLLQQAATAYKQGDLVRAEKICKNILKKQPMHAEANHLLGVIAFNCGKYKISEQCLMVAIRERPDYADAYSNYGVLLAELGRIKEAVFACGQAIRISSNVAAYHYNLGNALYVGREMREALVAYNKAIGLNPLYVEAYTNRGNVLKDIGQFDKALDAYGLALKLNPQMAEAHNNCANILRHVGRFQEALKSCDRAIQIKPSYAEAHHNRGSVLKEMGRLDEACEAFRSALAYNPNLVRTKYLLAALGKEAVPAQSPEDYVIQLFDGYADRFDNALVEKLSYHVPRLLFEETKGWMDSLSEKPEVLDLGCGTGLCGVEFQKYAKRLVGVDLSPRMLEKASARGIYTNLIQSDICEALNSTAEKFDLVLSADVFIYIGKLDAVFGLVCDILNSGGVFAFSVEINDGSSDYMLRETGRYAHSPGYIRELIEDHGLEVVAHKSVTIRYDHGVPVAGSIFLLRRQVITRHSS